MVKSYNELLREVVREMKERNVYHKLVSFKYRSKDLTNSTKWIKFLIRFYDKSLGFEKSFGDSMINIKTESKLTSQEEANRIKTNILFKAIMRGYVNNDDIYKISSNYTKVTCDDFKHKNRNEMFYMIHGGTVVASIGSIMLICLINSIFGIYCAIGFTLLLILNIVVIVINSFIIMKENRIFFVK